MHDSYDVLVIDDEESILRLFEKELSAPHRKIYTAKDGRQARSLLDSRRFDIVVSDIYLPDADGLDLLVEFRGKRPDLEIILITGHGNIDNAVEAMRIGAYDYITKPFNLDRVELVMERAYQRASLQRENRMLRHASTEEKPSGLVGNSAAIRHVRYLMEKVAPTEVPVLITGESGAGKDVVANGIHRLSRRASKPFVVKNCATLQKELMRSELFGHRRGSFTGAAEDREGLMTFADTGTLFLDEIGELPLEVQGALLRVLEAHTYRRVGEKDERQIDIRFLFATNRDLAEEVQAGRFHEALYHRINVFNISLPLLSERKEDIPLLVEHFLCKLCRSMAHENCRVTERAMQALMQYDWPGNVRELRNVLERGVILSESGVISERSFPRDIQVGGEPEEENIFGLDHMEKLHIRKALDFYGGNRQQAAKALGIGRKTLYRKMDKYSLN